MKRLRNAGSRKISFEEIYRMFGIKEPKGTWPKWGSQRLEVRCHFFHCALRQNFWALFIISEQISKQALSHQFQANVGTGRGCGLRLKDSHCGDG